jgi:hypothetical protein
MGLPRPFNALQLLWWNLMTKGIQAIALALEKGDPIFYCQIKAA